MDHSIARRPDGRKSIAYILNIMESCLDITVPCIYSLMIAKYRAAFEKSLALKMRCATFGENHFLL